MLRRNATAATQKPMLWCLREPIQAMDRPVDRGDVVFMETRIRLRGNLV
jgi:hypothetical protein